MHNANLASRQRVKWSEVQLYIIVCVPQGLNQTFVMVRYLIRNSF